MANEDVYLVRDDVSRFGLRRVHALQMGAPVDEAALLGRMGVDEAALMARLRYEEVGVGVWHVRLYWRAEPVGG